MELKAEKSRVGFWIVGFFLAAALLFCRLHLGLLDVELSREIVPATYRNYPRRVDLQDLEGELAMVAVPVDAREKFYFSVRDEAWRRRSTRPWADELSCITNSTSCSRELLRGNGILRQA